MPDAGSLAAASPQVYVVLAFVAGLCVPFEDGMRSLRGFGRWAFDKLPQKQPEGSR